MKGQGPYRDFSVNKIMPLIENPNIMIIAIKHDLVKAHIQDVLDGSTYVCGPVTGYPQTRLIAKADSTIADFIQFD